MQSAAAGGRPTRTLREDADLRSRTLNEISPSSIKKSWQLHGPTPQFPHFNDETRPIVRDLKDILHGFFAINLVT